VRSGGGGTARVKRRGSLGLQPGATRVASEVVITHVTSSPDLHEQATMAPSTTDDKQYQGERDVEHYFAKEKVSSVSAFPAACQSDLFRLQRINICISHQR
jgi:hypothetical protein